MFTEGGKTPIFFLANRGHHADIGGSTPGSMPPNSNHIQQEGAVFKSFLLVENGAFREKGSFSALFLLKSQVEFYFSIIFIENVFLIIFIIKLLFLNY